MSPDVSGIPEAVFPRAQMRACPIGARNDINLNNICFEDLTICPVNGYFKRGNMMTKIRHALFLFFVLSIVLLSGGTTLGATFPVSSTTEFRQALLEAAGNGEADTILLADGTYKTTDDSGGTFTYSVTESYDLTIRGSAPEKVVISGENTHRVLALSAADATATIHFVSLSLVNGYSTASGGGIHATSLHAVTLTNCILSGNTAGISGGGFYGSGPLILTHSTVTDNTAGISGGGFYGGRPLLVTDCSITNNTAGSDGGGFYADEITSGEKSASVTGCLISGNTAGEHGGGFYVVGAVERNTLVANTIVSANTANTSGAGVFLGGAAVVTNSIIINSTGAGGMYLKSGENNAVLNSIFINNDDSEIDGDATVAAIIHNNYIDESKIEISSFEKANNISGGNLGFADETNGDFHFGAESILIDKGTTTISGITFPETDYDGHSRIAGAAIDIGPYEFSNSRPTIDSFTYSGFPQAPCEITFAIEAIAYGDRTISKHEMDFGDGVFVTAAAAATHPYTTAGNYTVRARVTDSDGEMTTGSIDLLIIPIVDLPLLEKITDAYTNNDADAIHEAIDEIFGSGLSRDALAQAISEVFDAGLAILVEKNLDIADLTETMASMYSQEEFHQRVAAWDVDGDGKIGLADIIRNLQVLSAAGEPSVVPQ